MQRVDTKKFIRALQQHYDLIAKAKKKNKDLPQVSPFIGECIMHICEKHSQKSNFRQYPYLDEMVGDAMVHCFNAVKNGSFKTEKSDNVFGYFTRVANGAFIRRIEKERNGRAVDTLWTMHEHHEEASEIYKNLSVDQQDTCEKVYQRVLHNKNIGLYDIEYKDKVYTKTNFNRLSKQLQVNPRTLKKYGRKLPGPDPEVDGGGVEGSQPRP